MVTFQQAEGLNQSPAITVTDGVIGRPACRSLEILGAALQGMVERGPHSRPQASGEALAWTILPD